ncbi:MAG: L-lactate dehydrogenase [Aquabacterium sp.]|nr:L-lactate dehydrogenase [Aquabacterium sp.]
MHQTVGIIGTGWVGTSVAISTLHSGAADALWLHDVRGAVAEGEAMDLAHGAAFYPPCTVKVASIDAMRACQVVVVAAGHNGKPGESRLDLLRDNAQVVADIGRRLAGFDGTIVLVSNPVDVLTQVMTETSGLPPARVLGTGTLLDTARLRQMLGQRLHLATNSIHAQVVGEHGDSEVVLWSGAQVGGVPLRSWPRWAPADEEALALEVRRAADNVIARKGATNHAIGLVTAHLLRCMLRGERRVLTVSRVQTGAFGLQDVALSLPTVVGHDGGATVLAQALDAAELAALHRSAAVLRQAHARLQTPPQP